MHLLRTGIPAIMRIPALGIRNYEEPERESRFEGSELHKISTSCIDYAIAHGVTVPGSPA